MFPRKTFNRNYNCYSLRTTIFNCYFHTNFFKTNFFGNLLAIISFILLLIVALIYEVKGSKEKLQNSRKEFSVRLDILKLACRKCKIKFNKRNLETIILLCDSKLKHPDYENIDRPNFFPYIISIICVLLTVLLEKYINTIDSLMTSIYLIAFVLIPLFLYYKIKEIYFYRNDDNYNTIKNTILEYFLCYENINISQISIKKISCNSSIKINIKSTKKRYLYTRKIQ